MSNKPNFIKIKGEESILNNYKNRYKIFCTRRKNDVKFGKSNNVETNKPKQQFKNKVLHNDESNKFPNICVQFNVKCFHEKKSSLQYNKKLINSLNIIKN